MFDKNSFSTIQRKGLLVVDGDWLAFKVAAILENKSVQIYDAEGNFVKKFKTKTDFKKSKVYDETFEIRDSQMLKSNYQKTMEYRLNDLVNTYLVRTGCDRALVAMGGKTNFRNDLPLPQKYKGNREGETRPLALYETREKIFDIFETALSDNEEADDIISKYQFLSSKNPEEHIVVCTLDKDARGTPGKLYNPDKDTLVNIDGLGFLKLDKSANGYKLYGEGRMWFYSQLLTGDKADNYFPCDYYKQLVGNASKSPLITALKCYNLLAECKTDAECIKVLKDTYYGWYKDITSWKDWQGNEVEGTWVDMFQMYIDVVHMRRFDGDRVCAKDLLQRFGLLD